MDTITQPTDDQLRDYKQYLGTILQDMITAYAVSDIDTFYTNVGTLLQHIDYLVTHSPQLPIAVDISNDVETDTLPDESPVVVEDDTDTDVEDDIEFPVL